MRSIYLGLLVFSGAVAPVALAAEDDPLEAVERYVAALKRAQSNDDLKPFFSARQNADIARGLKKARAEKDPRKREMSLAFINGMYKFAQMFDLHDLELMKREQEGRRTRLDLKATAVVDPASPEKREKARGQVWLVREKGAWKIDEERWTTYAGAATPPDEVVTPPPPAELTHAEIPLMPSMKEVPIQDFTAEPAFKQFHDEDRTGLSFADPYSIDRRFGKVPPHRVRKFETRDHPRKVYLFYKNEKLFKDAGGWSSSYFHYDVENEADNPASCERCADAVFYRVHQNADGRAVQVVAYRPARNKPTQVFVFTQKE